MKPSEKQVSSKAIPTSKLGSRKSTIGIPDPKLITPERLMKNMKLSFVPPTKPKVTTENYSQPATSNYSVKNISTPVIKKPVKDTTQKCGESSPKAINQEPAPQTKLTSQKSASNIRATSQTRSAQTIQKPDVDLKGLTTKSFYKNEHDNGGTALPIRASSRNVIGVNKEPAKVSLIEKKDNVPITKSRPAKIILSRTKHIETCIKFLDILIRAKIRILKQKGLDQIIVQAQLFGQRTQGHQMTKNSDEKILSVSMTQKKASTNPPEPSMLIKSGNEKPRIKSGNPNKTLTMSNDDEPLPERAVQFMKLKAKTKIFNLLLTGFVKGFESQSISQAKFRRWKKQRTFDCWRAIVMHLRGRDPGLEFQSYTIAKMTRNISLLTKALNGFRSAVTSH